MYAAAATPLITVVLRCLSSSSFTSLRRVEIIEGAALPSAWTTRQIMRHVDWARLTIALVTALKGRSTMASVAFFHSAACRLKLAPGNQDGTCFTANRSSAFS